MIRAVVESLPVDPEFAALLDKITRERGFGCASYKEKCLKRRVAVRMRARGVHTYGEYGRLLDTDAAEYDRLLDALTINVTKLFRNWPVFASMHERVLPELWALDPAAVRVWSAGCSSGEEPYSLAALIHRHATLTGRTALLDRVAVLGTDIDRGSLEAAARGQFEESDFAETPDDLRTRYFAPTRPFTAIPAIRALTRFERRDLHEGAPAPGHFHLICCRNVLIYFDRSTQERLFDMFHRALVPGGFLVLGKVETVLGAARSRFTPVDARERIFRKP